VSAPAASGVRKDAAITACVTDGRAMSAACTLWAAGSLVRLDAKGNIMQQVAPGDESEPHGLALDHGAVWVALENGSLVHLRA
jgi:hypothetical protein